MYRGCDTLKLRLHPWKIDAWKTIWLPFWGNLGQSSGAIFCEGIHFSLPCLVKSWQQELLEAFKNATFNSAAGGGANPEGKKTPGPSWTPKNLNHEWRECTIERVCRHNHGKFTKVWLCFGHDSWHLFLWFESFLRFGLFFCFKLSLLLKHGCSKMQQSSLTRKKKNELSFQFTHMVYQLVFPNQGCPSILPWAWYVWIMIIHLLPAIRTTQVRRRRPSPMRHGRIAM